MDSQSRRINREMKTIRVMIGMYCRDNHGGARELCVECLGLWGYAKRRVDCCPFRADKPTCVRCPAHCYRPEMRERVRSVMRYAGPRMVWRHPILSALHLLDGVKTRHWSQSRPSGR